MLKALTQELRAIMEEYVIEFMKEIKKDIPEVFIANFELI